jgi:lambda family phage portal protein
MAIKDRIFALFRKKQQPIARQRMYTAARGSRLNGAFQPAHNSSADAEIVQSLERLRARSRALIRDASYATRARELVVNNVIGTGIGLQAQVMNTRGELNASINDSIETAWDEWTEADNCHTGGRLEFSQLERALLGEVFEAGEVFVRIHRRPFGDSAIPLALELIESERLADQFQSVTLGVSVGNELRMGVEVDQYFRPVAYFIRQRHPNDIYGIGTVSAIERVPAEDIIHLAIIDRWPQTRGVPWLHTAITRMSDMDGYSEAEITRARVQALTPGAIETPQSASSFGEEQSDGSVELEMQSGTYFRLNPGEKFASAPSGSPNPALEPFMRAMLREVAMGVGVSYESLSGDYSQGNYSSSRMGLLDARDIWRHLQNWFMCSFRYRVHKEWIKQAAFAQAINVPLERYALNPDLFEAVRFKPRGWSWVDPVHEVQAYRQAVMAGFTTVSDVISATAGGLDLEDVLDQREHELELMKAAGLVFDTSPELYNVKATPQGNTPAPAADNVPSSDSENTDDSSSANDSTPSRVVNLRG